jgi:hypothetical protein
MTAIASLDKGPQLKRKASRLAGLFYTRLWCLRFARACIESALRGQSDGALEFGRLEQ